MPQSVAQLPACSECGSEALGQAIFCFNCGARLRVDDPDNSQAGPDEGAGGSSSVVDRPIAPPPGDPFEQMEDPAGDHLTAESADDAPETEPVSSARTATAIRKGDAPARMRRIETRWIPEQESPNVWFIVASVLFFLAAFGIFLLSMYLR
ncbi:MAG: zinc ribbon domain-containing protein [Acidobacteriota bacterium]|nr:MAG: zinc ribbon domain-containing protein [Acidobacteriota bacterium]